MTWIPASRIASTSSQRFARAEPGASVWASSFEKRDGRPARDDRVRVDLLDGHPAMCDETPRHRPRGRSTRLIVSGRPCPSTSRRRHECRALRDGGPFLQHAEGLADAGTPHPRSSRRRRRSDDAPPGTAPAARRETVGSRRRRARHLSLRAPIQIEVELEDVDARLSNEPKSGVLVWRATQPRWSSVEAPRRRHVPDLEGRTCGADVGVESRRRRRHQLHRNRSAAVGGTQAVDLGLDALDQGTARRAEVEPPDAMPSYPAPAAEGRPQKKRGSGICCWGST